jgi:hypothetical protein
MNREQEMALTSFPIARGDRVRVVHVGDPADGQSGVVRGWDRHPNMPVHFYLVLESGERVSRTLDRLVAI